MIRPFSTWCVVIILLGFANVTDGQDRFQLPPGVYGGAPALLVQPAVQQELQMKPQQLAKTAAILNTLQQRHAQDLGGLQQAAPAQRWEAMVQLIQTMTNESFTMLQDVLSQEQLGRLKEIDLQGRGPRAFRDPEVQGKLKFTDEQKEKIQMISSEVLREAAVLYQSAPADRALAIQKLMVLRKAAVQKIEGLMDAEQQQIWKKLLGTPFGEQPASEPITKKKKKS